MTCACIWQWLVDQAGVIEQSFSDTNKGFSAHNEQGEIK